MDIYHPDLRVLREAVRDFAQSEIAPLAEQIDRDNTFPEQLWQKMGDMGLLGVTVSADYGGSDMGYLAHVICMEEISRASGSIGLSYGAHSNLCVNQIYRHGTQTQKLKYLPGLTSGRCVGALAMSEPGAGSDVVGMNLLAKKVGGGYVLNGSKMWITNGADADVVVVYAKTSPEQHAKGITAFLVDKDCAGFTHGQKLNKLGMRGSNTYPLFFDDCFVSDEQILGTPDGGIQVLMSGLDYERIVLAGGPLGIMHACLDVVLPYVKERHQFGQSIASFQLIQAKIADMYVKYSSARAYVYSVAESFDQQNNTVRANAAGAILFAAEQATQCALDAIQCLGGNGYIEEYPTGRLLRDAKLYEIGAGTSEIRRWLIGRELITHGCSSL